ncbi:hypothetical protein YC2023_094467 [Brassica napus]
MPLRLCLPSGPPTTPCCISSFVRGSVSPPLTHYTMQLQIYFPSLSGVWQWWLSLLDLLCSEIESDYIIHYQSVIFVSDWEFVSDVSVTLSLFDWQAISFHNKLENLRISPSYAPVGALGSRWTKAGVMSLSPCVQRSFSGLYHPSLVSCVA